MDAAESAILEELKTVTALLKVTSHGTIGQLLNSELKGEKAARVYEASDGATPQTEVGRKAGVGQATVSRLWQRWKTIGLAVEGESGRARAVFDASAYRAATGQQNDEAEG